MSRANLIHPPPVALQPVPRRAPCATLPLSTLLNERLKEAGSYTRYAPEVAGGRRWTDGREIRWETTPPARWVEKEGGMRLLFFSDDVTPREFRVPIRPPSNTDHPNGALVIAHLCEESFDISPTERAPWLFDLPGRVALKRHMLRDLSNRRACR
ncbi:hypothetical protein BC827DRAFT_646267 [Russula dissimulans]|nr:hypothetical protein BC827DRAFT_646267 [Russula dissimulans]